MNLIKKSKDFKKLKNNKFIGVLPQMVNSSIEFKGVNNVLYCDNNVKLVNSKINFNCNESIVFLCSNKNEYKLNLSLNNKNVLFIGKDNFFNGNIHIVLSEGKHCFIGNNCIFSFGIWMRNADPHLIYDSITKKRINNSKSIYIGDHVWVGQSAMILKGTQIDSGSIIGAMSVASGKKIGNNSTWAGNPIRKIKNNIFWDRASVHYWLPEQTNNSQDYMNYKKNTVDEYIFEYNKEDFIDFFELENIFNCEDMQKKIDTLLKLKNNTNKNRFVHKSGDKI